MAPGHPRNKIGYGNPRATAFIVTRCRIDGSGPAVYSCMGCCQDSGHAVMAFLQGIRSNQVSIVADADTVGRVVLGAWPGWANPESTEYRERAAFDLFQRSVRVDLAGQIAEMRYLGKRPRFGMHNDNHQAVEKALHLCAGVEETANALLRWLYLDTRDRLTSPIVWPAVQALATALIEERTLGRTAARALICTALRSSS